MLLLVFDPGVLERLALIALVRSAGFSLDEIGSCSHLMASRASTRRCLAAKAEELDRTIGKLSEMRDGLRHAAAFRALSHMECATFRRILRAAAPGAMEARKKRRQGIPRSTYHLDLPRAYSANNTTVLVAGS